MDVTTKARTIRVKFKEFFEKNYKDEIFKLLEIYPDEQSIVIDYNKLEEFDIGLADLLMDKPEEVLEVARECIKNIDPLVKDADINVRIENIPNRIPLENLNSKYIGSFVSVEGSIKTVNKVSPKIHLGAFECRGCMRLHTVEQGSGDMLIEPTLCSECGGRSFRLLEEESEYIDNQLLIIGTNETSRKLKIVLDGDLTSWDGYHIGQYIRCTGTLKTLSDKNGEYTTYLYCNYIEMLNDSIDIYHESEEPEKEYGERDSQEYNAWRSAVISRDRVCQCCGGDKHLQAHHIYGYKYNKDLRVDKENGITLCVFCHKKYHSYYGLANATPARLVKFIRRFGLR